MTVPSTTRRAGPYPGTGAAVPYPFNFKIFLPEDLEVTLTTIATGVEATGVLNSDYQVALNPDQDVSPGGAVLYTVAGIATALPTTLSLTITGGGIEFDQQADLQQGGNFNPVVIENALDRTVMQTQLLRDQLDSTLRLAVSTDPTVVSSLPSPVASSLIGWSADAKALVNYIPSIFGSTVTFAAQLASSIGASLVGFIQAGAGAVARTMQSKGRDLYHLRDFGVVSSTTIDQTALVQAALNAVSAKGGGVLSGEGLVVRLTAKVTIPSWVLFMGAPWEPDPSNTAQTFHTCLYIDWGAGADNHAIEMSHSSGIEGFTLFWPGQVTKSASTPTAFGYGISTPTGAGVYDNIHIRNITLYNAYKGIRLNNAGRWRVENVQGDPLFNGFTADNCLDTCYMGGVHFWTFYTQGDALETWVAANASGFLFNRIDQLFASKLTVWNRQTAYYCGSGLWANFTDIVSDRAESCFTIQGATQINVKGFVFIPNGTVKPAIWGISLGEVANFSSGRISDTACVGVEIDDGALYTFSNVQFDSRHASIVNHSSTAIVRTDASCHFTIPPWGTSSTYVDGSPLPAVDTSIALPAPTTGGGCAAISGGYKFPLDAVATPTLYWDVTTISQRCSLYILECTVGSNGTVGTAWYFQVLVSKDTGSDVNTAFNPLVPLVLNNLAGGKILRIPIHINHARFKTVVRISVQALSAVSAGTYISVTNIALKEQLSAKTREGQIDTMFNRGYCIDPLGKGKTLSCKGKARRIITEPEAGIGRAGATPSAGVWQVGDEVLLDTPTAGASPGVVCTTAGDFAGSAPTFKALPALAA